jgi:hypothetical protein|eukprot:symbB.v1.2.038270.t1/scaffold5902.1/size22562/1
MVRP